MLSDASHAWLCVSSESCHFAPGIGGVRFEDIEASGVEPFLKYIRDELVARTYQPMRVRRKEIPQANGTKVRVTFVNSEVLL